MVKLIVEIINLFLGELFLMYKLTIIIPIYNAENELRDTLNSIINQTMNVNDIEVIMVDDCSTDNSKNIMDEYCEKHENFKSIYLKENTGSPSLPRNLGIDEASSEYLMFLDSDDTLANTACEFLYDTITGENVDFVSGCFTDLDQNKDIVPNYWLWYQILYISTDNKDKLSYSKFNENMLSDDSFKMEIDTIKDFPTWLLDYGFFNNIYKKSIIQQKGIYYPVEINGGEDAVFLFNYMVNAKGLIFENKPVVIYNRYKDNSLSKINSLRTIFSRPEAYKIMYDLSIENDVKDEYVNILLPVKLNYWIGSHLTVATQLLNSEIISIFKDYKIIFEECVNYNVNISEEYLDIFSDIKNGDFEDACRKFNSLRIKNSNYQNSYIIQLSEKKSFKKQVNDILNLDFDFEDSEIIFINNSNADEDMIGEIRDNNSNIKFIPKSDDSKNIAIENALAQNLIFIDSTDQFTDSISKLTKICNNNDLDFIFSYNNLDDASGFDYDECFPIVYNREFIQNNDIKVKGNDESGLFNDSLLKSNNFRAINSDSIDEIISVQENCKVSVIMPVYNAGRYLKDSIDCILNQTLSDVELICVDDGSEDNSMDILKDFASKDKRVQFYCQNHGGGGAARNFALKKAVGKYFYFMDSDDLIKPNALERLYGKIEESNVDFVLCKSVVWDSDNDEYLNRPYFSMDPIYDLVGDKIFNYNDVKTRIFDFSVTPWAKLFNREFVIKSGAQFGEGLIFHDHFFFWEMLFNSETIQFLNEELCIYRIHSKSSTESKDSRFLNFFDVYDGIYDIFIKYDKFNYHERSLYNIKVNGAIRRYYQIQQEFKSSFFDKMKRNFANMANNEKYNFKELLNYETKIIVNCVFESENYSDFDFKLIHVMKSDLLRLNRENIEFNSKTNDLNNKIKSQEIRIKQLEESNKKLQKSNAKIEKINNEIFSSKSWKITSPLRKLRNSRK